MSLDVSEKSEFEEAYRRDRATEVAQTFEWIIIAFILALVFRAFAMEPFRIPTGSMANTLAGAHFRIRCLQCGYKYDHGFDPQDYGLAPDTVPGGNVRPPSTRCPSCGQYAPGNKSMPIVNGDRVLVLKCAYQLFEPKRWDVVVFKNPPEPPINYIKRLIGLAGETVEIIDGDIYIDGRISRKPAKVQRELWMPVYDNDYQPVRPKECFFNHHSWQQPFKNIEGSNWGLDDDSPTIFRLDSAADEINTIFYDTDIGNNFRGAYAYNEVQKYAYQPFCSDLKVRFYADSAERRGSIGVSLSKYETHYKAWVDFGNGPEGADLAGEMVIAKVRQGKEEVLERKPVEVPGLNKPTLVKFINVDHQLIFQFGVEKLVYDLGRGPDDAGERTVGIQPSVKIFGSGKLMLSHIAIFRDIHYTESNHSGRAMEGSPFTLGKDEFFVLGDNSPNSEDSRWWARRGMGNNGVGYRRGIVPREYLMGKALFVYWPCGFRASGKSGIAFIPNIGRMRFIYSGSNRKSEIR